MKEKLTFIAAMALLLALAGGLSGCATTGGDKMMDESMTGSMDTMKEDTMDKAMPTPMDTMEKGTMESDMSGSMK